MVVAQQKAISAANKENNMKNINQKRGPTTGNAGNVEKRDTFMAEKSKTSSERAAIARGVLAALETRGRDNRSSRSAGLENLKGSVNEGRGPTRGNAGKK